MENTQPALGSNGLLCDGMDKLLDSAQGLLEHAAGCLESMTHPRSPLMRDVVGAKERIEEARRLRSHNV